tara:strand:- start:27 stop:617 length:591 start_codon:yes stop_codon:yes gene_type:complete
MIQLEADKLNRQQKGIDLISNFNRAVPGQSLTNSPDQAYKWEQPSEFSTVKECLTYIYDNLLEEEAFDNLTTALSREVPIFDLASAILYTGFLEGKWNPDLMLLLVEPLTYMLMSMGEMYGLESDEMVLSSDDNPSVDDPEVQMKTFQQAMEKAKLSSIENNFKKENNLPTEIKEKLQELPQVKGLLERTEENNNG